ncbi:hypothetical protein [Streptomyces sp. NPDC046925]|uniref:hypothetical protein n=1 Tax=Streptomyces sp. NPDC046925 TaxID=3155375 RepID=UPI0033C77731
MHQNQAPATTRTLHWRVSAFDRSDRSLAVSHPLHATAARHQYAYWSGHVSVQPVDGRRGRVTLAEETTDKTMRVIGLADLPGPGQPTELPALPEGAHEVRRHYRFNHGPVVHRTGDDARAYLKWLTERQERPTPTTVRVDLSTLVLFEVTLTFYERSVELSEIPESG